MNIRNTTYTRKTNIPENVYLEAENRAENLPIHKNSQRGLDANAIGCLGELIIE